LPWSALKYNERLGGYEVNTTEDQLKKARSSAKKDWNVHRGQQVYDYYKAPYI
jgi:hypothetical protein